MNVRKGELSIIEVKKRLDPFKGNLYYGNEIIYKSYCIFKGDFSMPE
jgi:hypothetical protein